MPIAKPVKQAVMNTLDRILCFNCDSPLDVPHLFCSQLCTDMADFVRSVRRWREAGKENEPEIRYATRVKKVHILNGGYPAKERELSPSVRQQVIRRDKGLCRMCGRPGEDVDHIRGNSDDLNNLQYLCKECHMKKTMLSIGKLTPDHPRYDEFMTIIRAIELRCESEKSSRHCDDHVLWKTVWQEYKAERELAFHGAEKPKQLGLF